MIAPRPTSAPNRLPAWPRTVLGISAAVFARAIVTGLGLALLWSSAPALAQTPAEGTATGNAEVRTVAVLDTNHGRMAWHFHDDVAPRTSAHIRSLIEEGFYDGKHFYRVVAGHVIQGGDQEGTNVASVPLEAGLPHIVGAVGLARDSDPDSGTSEIYICHARRPHLDGSYAVFGQLVEGLDVLDRIATVPVDEHFVGDGVAFHSPKEAVVIERAFLEERVLRPSPPEGKDPADGP